ncbi:unnamed protein product [Cylindrotheca closterium]|uniref:VWFA domain-containing protein n=1 Tax=Cylindrotheca closterium TaxID=2856 RepID=A0AAD2G6U0_9STRA|nr:unnamed protein product [Cylindrotheca closterium]
MTKPKKYVKVNGIMKLNPEWKKWKEQQGDGGPATTVQRPSVALPIVSSMEDHEKLNEASLASGGQEIPFSESTSATIEMMQEPEICVDAGMDPDTVVDELGALLNKYEVPIGLMNKLMMLSEFEVLEFMIDDSGSMTLNTDSVDRQGRPQTRWTEAQGRLKEMIEVLAHVPFNQIVIVFLNRTDVISLQRNKRDPKTIIADANQKIDSVFSKGPSGTTPALEKIQKSLTGNPSMSIARWFFGDGVPNGGIMAQKEITRLLVQRPNPAQNPMTFISCTNEDDQVEWMKDAEEAAPYCSESDDFRDEAAEVMRDQGAALPYSKGFHLVGTLVGAMNPDDLDAMDESIPFTKSTLDNLLGIQHNEESYRHYFNLFAEAQSNRKVEGPMDNLKRSMRWNYNDFLQAPLASQIAAVQDFKGKLKTMGG